MERTGSVFVAALLMIASASLTRADTYDYTVDRFEVDGNIFGPLDGTPDLVDGFDDGTMGPVFTATAGTVDESGGFLHLRDPGTAVAIPGVTPVRFETSAVAQSTWVTSIQAGSGDFVARMVLPAQPIGPNDGVNLLVQSNDDGLYYAGVSIVNFSASLAARQQPPITPGLSILAHQEVISFSTGNQQLLLDHESIEGAPITGPIVLALHYDDTAQTVTPTYSLDGGASFAGTFAPLPIASADGKASFYLAAVAHEGACPDGAAITAVKLRNLGEPGRSRLTLKARHSGEHVQAGARRIIVTDDGAAGAVVLDLQLPDTLVTTPRCDPRDGWSSPGSSRVRYDNYSNALPPDCIPGSAQGVRRMEMRWTGTNHVKLKLVDGSLPPVVGPLRVGFYGGTGPVNSCDGNVGVANCRILPGRAKCSFEF